MMNRKAKQKKRMLGGVKGRTSCLEMIEKMEMRNVAGKRVEI